jgi:hypothetical protein
MPSRGTGQSPCEAGIKGVRSRLAQATVTEGSGLSGIGTPGLRLFRAQHSAESTHRSDPQTSALAADCTVLNPCQGSIGNTSPISRPNQHQTASIARIARVSPAINMWRPTHQQRWRYPLPSPFFCTNPAPQDARRTQNGAYAAGPRNFMRRARSRLPSAPRHLRDVTFYPLCNVLPASCEPSQFELSSECMKCLLHNIDQ